METIGAITIGIEEGLLSLKVPGKIRMETPAGLVKIQIPADWKKSGLG